MQRYAALPAPYTALGSCQCPRVMVRVCTASWRWHVRGMGPTSAKAGGAACGGQWSRVCNNNKMLLLCPLSGAALQILYQLDNLDHLTVCSYENLSHQLPRATVTDMHFSGQATGEHWGHASQKEVPCTCVGFNSATYRSRVLGIKETLLSTLRHT